MSVIARLLSSSVARGLAALLAVLLSAVIGGRLGGVDRLSLELTDEDSPLISCPLVADLVVVAPVVVGYCDRPLLISRVEQVTGLLVPVTTDHLSAPSQLLGSAGGPRAP